MSICIKRSAVVVILFALSATGAAASDCKEYPLNDGLSVTQTPSGPKIMSTSTVSVAMDDVDEVLEASAEAEKLAKAALAKFFNETIQTEEALDKAVETQISIVGDKKDVAKKTLKTQMTSIRNSAREVIKGAVQIGSCYTKGELVKLTVGIKPETVAAAIDGRAMVNQEPSDEADGQSTEEDNNSSGSLNGVDGFSNTKGITDF